MDKIQKILSWYDATSQKISSLEAQVRDLEREQDRLSSDPAHSEDNVSAGAARLAEVKLLIRSSPQKLGVFRQTLGEIEAELPLQLERMAGHLPGLLLEKKAAMESEIIQFLQRFEPDRKAILKAFDLESLTIFKQLKRDLGSLHSVRDASTPVVVRARNFVKAVAEITKRYAIS